MSSIRKHVGKIKSTNQSCVVVFMSLPETPDRALVVNVDSLNERYESLIMDLVNSQEGQHDNELASTMGRRMVPETGRTVLEEFHHCGLLRAESVDNIVMLPRPNNPFELRDILVQMGVIKDGVTAQTAPLAATPAPLLVNPNATNEERLQIANNILIEADLLQEEVHQKREQAYTYAPELRPASEPDNVS